MQSINVFIVIHPSFVLIINFTILIGMSIDNILSSTGANPSVTLIILMETLFNPRHPLHGSATPVRSKISLNLPKWQVWQFGFAEVKVIKLLIPDKQAGGPVQNMPAHNFSLYFNPISFHKQNSSQNTCRQLCKRQAENLISKPLPS